MLEASKVTIGEKTYDLNYLGKKKKTNLRRKLIIELIQSKPAGEVIRLKDFQEVGHFSTTANTYSFIKRMERDGVIQQFNGDRPRDRYYAVTGATRQVRPPDAPQQAGGGQYDFTTAINNLKAAGLEFTITISNKK